MNAQDYPKKSAHIRFRKSFPEIAIYEFFPEGGRAEVSFRCRLRKSSYLMIIADMKNGTVSGKKISDVILGSLFINAKAKKT